MRYLAGVVFLIVPFLSVSQLLQKPLPLPSIKNSKVEETLEASHTVPLPFWDDFSSGNNLLDTIWWTHKSQNQTSIKQGVGINPPSVGVLTFDGVDSDGVPYSPTPSYGEVDNLVSQFIDLEQVPKTLMETVYLSFFYQFKGLGESPDMQDSLILYLKNKEGVWNKVWPKTEKYNKKTEKFTEVFIKIDSSNYFHDQFQFMFKAFGQQSGAVDNWLVDYVYMDKRRSPTNASYLDRTFVNPPTTIFDQYTAIPFNEFAAAIDKKKLFDSLHIKFRNLEIDVAPVEYSVNLYDTITKTLVEVLVDSKPLLIEKNTAIEKKAPPINASDLLLFSDSLFLKLEYKYTGSGDTLVIDSVYCCDSKGEDIKVYYPNVDFRKNDVTETYLDIHDYYAYDDGSAEYTAGINQQRGRFAFQYQVITGQYLKKIDIYFPPTSGSSSSTPFELFVLKDFEGSEKSVIFTTNGTTSHMGINKFTSFNLPQPMYITDTFYIGLTNLSSTNQWLGVGLDKNTDAFDKVFVNLDGEWTPNVEVHGSLMIRPYFSTKEILLGVEPPLSSIEVYPNPSYGTIKIKGAFNTLKLVDMLGNNVQFEVNDRSEIFYTVSSPKLLILMVKTQEGFFKYRILAFPEK